MKYSLFFLTVIPIAFVANASDQNHSINANFEQIEMVPSEHQEEDKLLEMIQDKCNQLIPQYYSQKIQLIPLRGAIEFFEYDTQRMNIFELIKESLNQQFFERSKYILNQIRKANLSPKNLQNIILNLQEEIQNTIRKNPKKTTVSESRTFCE